jgi:TRAP transporter TAXI family solute receptor
MAFNLCVKNYRPHGMWRFLSTMYTHDVGPTATSLGLSCLLLAQCVGAGCTEAPPQDPTPSIIRVSKVFSGAQATQILSQVPGVVLTQTVSGGAAVLDALRQHNVDIGEVMADAAYLAYTGQLERGVGPFDQLRGIAVVGLSTVHLIVGPGAHVNAIGDLRNLRVGVGASRSALALTVERLLRAFGLSPSDLHGVSATSTEAAALLVKGQLDAAFIAVDIDPPESPGLTATKAGGRVIEIVGDQVDLLRLQYPFLVNTLIPADTYPHQHSPLRTVGVDLLLASRVDIADDVVYRLMEQYFAVAIKSSLALDYDRAAAMAIPLHPAAARYYRRIELSR